jgi:excisionase family DNA binding protein
MIDKEKYITTSELAKMLGISRVAVFKKLKSGEIKATEYGNSYIIEKDSLPIEIKEKIKKLQDEAVSKAVATDSKDLGFEKELWEAADKLRGNIDASEYKHIVLGLLFLKYISDSYYQRRLSLEEWTSDSNNKDYYTEDEKDKSSIINDKDQYVGAGVFYVPKKSRWEFLCEKLSRPDLGKYIDEAMDAVENENQKQLKGVLPKIYTKTTLESEELGDIFPD